MRGECNKHVVSHYGGMYYILRSTCILSHYYYKIPQKVWEKKWVEVGSKDRIAQVHLVIIG